MCSQEKGKLYYSSVGVGNNRGKRNRTTLKRGRWIFGKPWRGRGDNFRTTPEGGDEKFWTWSSFSMFLKHILSCFGYLGGIFCTCHKGGGKKFWHITVGGCFGPQIFVISCPPTHKKWSFLRVVPLKPSIPNLYPNPRAPKDCSFRAVYAVHSTVIYRVPLWGFCYLGCSSWGCSKQNEHGTCPVYILHDVSISNGS